MDTHTRPRLDRREQLLLAGEKAFAKAAYEDVSVDDITERAGVAHGLFFHYFGSKRKFFVELLRREAARDLQRLSANPHRRPSQWLRLELDTYLDSVVAQSFIARRLLHGVTESDLQPIVDQQRAATVRRYLDVMRIEKPTPILEVALYGWIASSMEAAHQWLVSHPSISRARMRALLSETLAGMLAAVAAADPGAGVDPDFFR